MIVIFSVGTFYVLTTALVLICYLFPGIWPEGADGTDINACCRSDNEEFLITGDDFGQVNFFRYPCTKMKVGNLIHKNSI